MSHMINKLSTSKVRAVTWPGLYGDGNGLWPTDCHHSFQPYEPNVGMAARRAAFDNGVNGLQIHVSPSVNLSRCALPASARLIWRRLAPQMRKHLAGLCGADTERQFAFR